jgi:hypothetical protein
MAKIIENYYLHKIIGEGISGIVYRGVNMRTN